MSVSERKIILLVVRGLNNVHSHDLGPGIDELSVLVISIDIPKSALESVTGIDADLAGV